MAGRTLGRQMAVHSPPVIVSGVHLSTSLRAKRKLTADIFVFCSGLCDAAFLRRKVNTFKNMKFIKPLRCDFLIAMLG